MNAPTRFSIVLFVVLILGVFAKHSSESQENSKTSAPCTWEVCSIDTMKNSRDKARAELNNPAYDETIKSDIQAIKETGANYVAIGTPYDDEFLPYLKRWVKHAREKDLSVWFRGNWANWEGWFEYPKNLTPENHIKKTAEFIEKNPDLFEDGDIFDACPECENAGFWPQPHKDEAYRTFVKDQEKSVENAFKRTGKNVISNYPSIIGGRAKEVLDMDTVTALDKTVAIDHYFKNPESITEYINEFKNKYGAATLVSETGAPIPDMHGNMSEDDQAQFIKNVLERIYVAGNSVSGLNYWVLSNGTTALINPDGSKRKAFDILTTYYSPGVVTGFVTNTLGEPLPFLPLITSDGVITHTDKNGEYIFKIPRREFSLSTDSRVYNNKESKKLAIKSNFQKMEQDFVLIPNNPSFIYQIKLFIKNKLKNNIF